MRHKWKESDVELLRQLYPNATVPMIAERLGVTEKSIYYKAWKLQLKKSPEFMASANSGRIQRGKLHPSMIASQFKPGVKVWNAGRKGWQAGGRSKETQFTTGMVPPNTVPIGTVRVIVEKNKQAHLQIKVNDESGPAHKRWLPVSRVVWEKVHGPLEKGSIVVFKPGMRTLEIDEITIDKLECRTRAEHAQRNHPRDKDPELGKLYQLKGAITRQVNRLKKESEQAK